MAISPLAAAMMTGNVGSNNGMMLGAIDPALLAAQPEIQLGSGLMQQGTSTAPAYPAQALARALSGAIGANLTKSAMGDLARAYANVPEQAADVLAQEQPGNPAIGMLRSPNPMVRMMGLQMMQRTIPIQSEVKSLGPNTTAITGGGIPVGQGNPQLAGQVAGAEAAAEAPFKPAGETTVTGPNGPVKRPISAAELASLSGGNGVTPTAAVPPPQPGQSAPQQGAPNAPQIGETPSTEAAFEAGKGAGTATGEAAGEAITAGGKPAHMALNELNTIQDSLFVGGTNVPSGPWADRVTKMKELLNGLGLDTSWVKAGTPEAEVITKLNSQLASAASRQMTARPTQFEFKTWLQNNPGMLTTKEGTMALISIMKQAYQQDIGLGQLGSDPMARQNWDATVNNFYKSHPLVSPFTGKPMVGAMQDFASKIDPKAIQMLREKPETAHQFDQHFGTPGLSQYILGGAQ